jgi:cyclopropane fatty-acyl-phospholipid synthase-like methyltransferase
MMGVEQFYDGFAIGRMLEYRIHGNLRLDLAKRFVLNNINPNDRVVDIGCGIGIISEAVAMKHAKAMVVGIDISDRNIEFARRTIKKSNVRFEKGDIASQAELLSNILRYKFDVFMLIDVVEHVPESRRARLLADIAALSSSNARLLITYPSPEYQKYLAVNNQDELQIIDNVIELNVLEKEAGQSGWALQSFCRINAWMTNQYVHAVFVRESPIKAVSATRRTLAQQVVRKVDEAVGRRYRKWRYSL